jgi:hypothetical protein
VGIVAKVIAGIVRMGMIPKGLNFFGIIFEISK